jgi:2,4-dienoyl-CoA reductase-like NADH-dependent reductase (Old Yellow Enzyme family)
VRQLEEDRLGGPAKERSHVRAALAAQRAMDAGFEGVELHGANGYLVDQFLQDGSNERRDEYGDSLENRTRFLLEIVTALISVWGNSRVAVRLGPGGTWFEQVSARSPQNSCARTLLAPNSAAGKYHRECRTALVGGFNERFPAVCFGDLADDEEPESYAATGVASVRAACHRLEQARLSRKRDRRPLIVYGDGT